jgi:DnaD/phage-associated family protein
MARKRFVTSDISTDGKVASLAEENPIAALMWPWFLTALDDWGRMGANPVEVKLTVFPAFPYTSKDIAEVIRLYDVNGLAHYYKVDDKEYLAVCPEPWYKYQTYIKKERQEKQQLSKFPAPPNPPWENRSSAIVADDQQQSATNVLSLSLSLSPSLSKDLNNDDDNNARAREDINFVKTCEQEFGRLVSPTELETLQSFVDDGMSEEVVCEAIKRTRLNGHTKVGYTKSILNNWHSKGVKDMAGVSRIDLEFEQRKARDGPGGGHTHASHGSRDRPVIQADVEQEAANGYFAKHLKARASPTVPEVQ